MSPAVECWAAADSGAHKRPERALQSTGPNPPPTPVVPSGRPRLERLRRWCSRVERAPSPSDVCGEAWVTPVALRDMAVMLCAVLSGTCAWHLLSPGGSCRGAQYAFEMPGPMDSPPPPPPCACDTGAYASPVSVASWPLFAPLGRTLPALAMVRGQRIVMGGRDGRAGQRLIIARPVECPAAGNAGARPGGAPQRETVAPHPPPQRCAWGSCHGGHSHAAFPTLGLSALHMGLSGTLPRHPWAIIAVGRMIRLALPASTVGSSTDARRRGAGCVGLGIERGARGSQRCGGCCTGSARQCASRARALLRQGHTAGGPIQGTMHRSCTASASVMRIHLRICHLGRLPKSFPSGLVIEGCTRPNQIACERLPDAARSDGAVS